MSSSEETEVKADSDRHELKQRVLEPFVHQVSGRAHMLTLDPKTLCKSLSRREWSFYNKLPTSLQRFTPRLKGLLVVRLEKGNCSTHRFLSSNVWYPHCNINNNANMNGDCESHVKQPSKDNLVNGLAPAFFTDAHWCRVCEKTLFKGLERVQYNDTDGFTGHKWTVDKDQEAVTEALGKNPWALRQHKREINRTLRGDVIRNAEGDLFQLREEIGLLLPDGRLGKNDRFTKTYLLLEDVTSNYQFPSILDLKIGTQLDRLGCSPAKRDKHYNLVQKSSTGSLGLRLAGMQVYQVTNGQYLCRDKYYGRGLSTKGFIDALGQFLHNGQRTVTDVIPPIVDILMLLRSELEQQESFRFHASSVLIVYEGGPVTSAMKETETCPLSQKEVGSGLDGFENGTFINSQSHTDIRVRDGALHDVTARRHGVHMIDFAHSTFKGFLDDKTVYQGPDKDCLYALDNLVSVLNHILKNAVTS